MEAIRQITGVQKLDGLAAGEIAQSPVVIGLIPPAEAPPQRSAPTYVNGPAKRALDIMGALALIAFLAPALLLIAAAIKVTSRGPVFFRQERGGAGQTKFMIWKFRTMCRESAHETGFLRQACRQDARVTAVGGFLRRYSLDELPQLFNVVTGEMSLVGPRPHAVSHDAHFAVQVPNYTGRFSCRPGMTGLAQTSGARGETKTANDMQKRVDYDLLYINSASLRGDLVILARTSWMMFVNEDAY